MAATTTIIQEEHQITHTQFTECMHHTLPNTPKEALKISTRKALMGKPRPVSKSTPKWLS